MPENGFLIVFYQTLFLKEMDFDPFILYLYYIDSLKKY